MITLLVAVLAFLAGILLGVKGHATHMQHELRDRYPRMFRQELHKQKDEVKR